MWVVGLIALFACLGLVFLIGLTGFWFYMLLLDLNCLVFADSLRWLCLVVDLRCLLCLDTLFVLLMFVFLHVSVLSLVFGVLFCLFVWFGVYARLFLLILINCLAFVLFA